MAADFDRPVTLFLILDAFRHDYLEHAPFLRSLADWTGSVRESFGFISTRPAMIAGQHPEQTGLCYEYLFRPEGKTFRWRWCAPLAPISRVVPSRYTRLAASLALRLTSRSPIVRQTAMVGHTPFHLLPYFDIAEDRLPVDPRYLDQPTVFDLLAEHGQRYLYFGFARPKPWHELPKRVYSAMIRHDLLEADRTMARQCERALQREPVDLVHLHFCACDWVGHKYGPDSPETREAIRVTDDLCRQIVERLRQRYRQVRVLASADHGMVEVTEHHDIHREVLDALGIRQPRDYLIMLDSTSARFWFFNPDAEVAVREALVRLTWGSVIDDEARSRYHIRFKDDANGSLIFLLKPGVVLLPNHYQSAGAPPRGMHGYAPETPDNHGAILMADDTRDWSTVPSRQLDLVDVFPALLDLHGLPKPAGLPGRSILDAG
ncbi:MAG: alkaline phosphatase family protein [Planctomycetota bacterium]